MKYFKVANTLWLFCEFIKYFLLNFVVFLICSIIIVFFYLKIFHLIENKKDLSINLRLFKLSTISIHICPWQTKFSFFPLTKKYILSPIPCHSLWPFCSKQNIIYSYNTFYYVSSLVVTVTKTSKGLVYVFTYRYNFSTNTFQLFTLNV